MAESIRLEVVTPEKQVVNDRAQGWCGYGSRNNKRVRGTLWKCGFELNYADPGIKNEPRVHSR